MAGRVSEADDHLMIFLLLPVWIVLAAAQGSARLITRLWARSTRFGVVEEATAIAEGAAIGRNRTAHDEATASA